MKNKLLITLILTTLLISIASAQIDYSKCINREKYAENKIEKSMISKLLSFFFMPLNLVNLLTSYTIYEKEINCGVNETLNHLGLNNG